MKPQFWVNDKTRMCSVTVGAENAADVVRNGFREVTGDEQDAFREETVAIKAAKGGKKKKGLTLQANAEQINALIQDFNK